MGDALSLGELRGVVFALVVLSSFALLVGMIPASFHAAATDRDTLDIPDELFRAVDLTEYDIVYTETLTAPEDDYANSSGDVWYHFYSDSANSCMQVVYIYHTGGLDLGPDGDFTWYYFDRETKASVTTWLAKCGTGPLGLITTTQLLPGYALDAGYGTGPEETGYAIVDYGYMYLTHAQGTIDFYYTYNETAYVFPSDAWSAGALTILVGVDLDQKATVTSGFNLIISMLTFQEFDGIPWYLADLFGFFMWALIAIISVALISRFIPFT